MSSPPTKATEPKAPRKFLSDIPDKLPETREDLIQYIMNHPRYFTMHSWNGLTTWARCIKINHLELTNEERNKAYEFICDCDDLGQSQASEEAWFEFKDAMDCWAENHKGYKWYTNGRSGGYVLMCSDEKTCGGMCLNPPDAGEIIDDNVWDLRSIKDVAQDLFDFDWAVNVAITCYVDFCMTHEIMEDTIQVSKKVRSAVERELRTG